MHTKKTNNTNKLIQISYHSILTKIQKLQNFKKKKKKNFFLYRPVRPVPAGIARNWPVRGRYARYFFRYETGGSNVPDCWPVRYIPAVPAGTVRNWQHWVELLWFLKYSLIEEYIHASMSLISPFCLFFSFLPYIYVLFIAYVHGYMFDFTHCP